ncbi:alpha-2,8-sialyltransferase 8E isoform X8 [Nerophis lumbriciformis]|uniref:alpha-2,8-sialyltransferase 8E isoform X8 n=1 Tax=Nerophis lumbriciformis TaxID=546530 RepID=UPI002AE0AAD3|nr:alpha-2,8-sialyltransferase 8E-like isoform X8 [Nerophis lumbriciformis]
MTPPIITFYVICVTYYVGKCITLSSLPSLYNMLSIYLLFNFYFSFLYFFQRVIVRYPFQVFGKLWGPFRVQLHNMQRAQAGDYGRQSLDNSLCLSARVKTSDLFERWRNLQVCKWEQSKEETSNFKMSLSRCCNAPSFLFTTKKNTPAGTKLRYEVDTSGILPITTEVFKMFPDDMPYSKSQYKKCAVIGNGGIIKNTNCGKEIDSADFVFRCNIPPISEKYSADVGTKTDLVTVNPSIITERFQKLEKWRRPFFDVLQNYENSSVVLPAFYNLRNTDMSFRVKYMLDDFDSQRGAFFFHPQYLLNVQRFWAVQGVRAKRLSSGLMLVTAALEMCEEVHLYGFWAFPMNPLGIFITHHYYDNVKPRPGFHAMPHEIFNFIHMHARGIVHVHTGPCT